MTERMFFALLGQNGVPLPEMEYRFAPPRKFRFDYCWPKHKLALEVDGGVWMKGGGRHTRGSGWTKDSEKLNLAACMGYRLLRVTPQQLVTISTLELIQTALEVAA